MTIIIQIIHLYYDYMFLPLQYHIIYINTHLSVIVPKSNPPLLAYLIWCSSSPFFSFLLSPSSPLYFPQLTNYNFHIYTALGDIAKQPKRNDNNT